MAMRMADNENMQGDMSVSEAGHKGGERVRELINEGKESEMGSEGDDETQM